MRTSPADARGSVSYTHLRTVKERSGFHGYSHCNIRRIYDVYKRQGGALLGAPLSHDFLTVSLSDLLTPLEVIKKRIRCAAQSDTVICIYNPSSRKRGDYLRMACEIALEYLSPDTVCGYVKNIGREGEEAAVLTLEELRDTQVDMFTTVFIGNSHTRNIHGKMVTPRGYRLEEEAAAAQERT